MKHISEINKQFLKRLKIKMENNNKDNTENQIEHKDDNMAHRVEKITKGMFYLNSLFRSNDSVNFKDIGV